MADKALSGSKLLFGKWKKKPPRKLDDAAKNAHDEVFEELDCLKCANCCKSISPVITYKDMERMAGALRMRPSDFMEKYLRQDEDNDFVFIQTPCPFLMRDNYCQVYDSRPKACREYPHTDRIRFYQILDLTLKNTFVCPAAYHVVEILKRNSDIK
ncbi:MAG: YkgJ family cysteine cluster protein [Bacteroidales bacterium]|nr:YkgJ family cysteine cluster protein [Bacteroidales bacterium]